MCVSDLSNDNNNNCLLYSGYIVKNSKILAKNKMSVGVRTTTTTTIIIIIIIIILVTITASEFFKALIAVQRTA